MIVSRNVFVVATKKRPIEFIDENNDNVKDICAAYFNLTEKDALSDLDAFDEPDEYEIWPVKVTYEF